MKQKGDGEPKLEYIALLIYFEDFESGYNLTNIPLLLCNGSMPIVQTVNQTLQVLFDAVIRPVDLSKVIHFVISSMFFFTLKSVCGRN